MTTAMLTLHEQVMEAHRKACAGRERLTRDEARRRGRQSADENEPGWYLCLACNHWHVGRKPETGI